MTWPVTTVGEVCQVVSGATPRTGKPEFWDGDVPWVTPRDLSELAHKHLSDTPRKITMAGLKSCSARMLPAQSVLLSSRAPIGLVAINTLPVCTNQGFKSLVPRPDSVSPDFLFWWLKSHQEHIQRKGRGATFKEVSKKIVEDLQIPLPPLAEQKRIAEILDAADALRAKRHEALAQLDTLLQSTFLDMFGDPVTNPKGWTVTSVGDMAKMGTGSTPLRRRKDYFDGSIPWVKSTEVDWGTVTTTSECLSSRGVRAARLKLYPKGSIVLALYGQGKTRGKCAVLGIDATINQACCALVPRDPVSTPYLFQFLKHSYHRLRGESRGGNQENLNMGIVRSFSVPVPPSEIQRRYARIAESIEEQKTRQRAHLAELNTLFTSLQSHAFRGEL